jgi:hypothetical protein
LAVPVFGAILITQIVFAHSITVLGIQDCVSQLGDSNLAAAHPLHVIDAKLRSVI